MFITTGSARSLEYFMLTSPIFLPPSLIGSSDAITVPGGFPFGSQRFFFIYVRIWNTEALLPCNQKLYTDLHP